MASPLLLEAGVVFAVIAVGGGIASRLDQSVIPAYIVAGILLGPHAPTIGGYSLAIVDTSEFVDLLAELGIVFLLFFIGLEFNLERLVAARDRIVRAGTLDLAVNFAVGFGLGLAFGFSAFEALFLAGIVYVSSSAVITKSLIELGWIADPESEAILGVLVFEDVVVAVYLAVLSAVALSAGDLASIARSLAVAFGFLIALVSLAAYGTDMLERAFDVRSDEVFLLRVVGLTVLVGGIALAAGVSEAVAAFFLGAAFGGTDHAHRIERVITSERDIYAAVFFLAIGLRTDPRLFPAVAAPLAALVTVTTASKLLSGYYGGRFYGLSERRSVRAAIALVARGEFSLVIAALAVSAGGSTALSRTIPAIAVGYVLAMSLLGTVLMRYSGRVERLVVGESPS
ncbi:MAG: cation:proton antiporter [Haloglomus sp.]